MLSVALSVTVVQLVPPATPAQADDGPSADSSDAAWQAWAQDAFDEAEATDWAALSAAEGCRLLDVTVSELVDERANAERGAPADLAVPVVERTEECEATATSARGGAATTAMASGCAATSGPGSLCLARSGSYVTTSFRYDGGGTVTAFLKIYAPSSLSGCPTGPALATGASQTYEDGTRRSLSVYAPDRDGYSSHVWRHVGAGIHSDWGAVCATL